MHLYDDDQIKMIQAIRRWLRQKTRGRTQSPTIYYIAGDGDDTHDGKHPLRAWNSIERLNRAKKQIKANDQILFKRGYSYVGRPFYIDHADGEKQIGA